MPKIWRNRIIAGDKSFASCPFVYKAAVKLLLQQDVANGIISEEKFEEIISNK